MFPSPLHDTTAEKITTLGELKAYIDRISEYVPPETPITVGEADNPIWISWGQMWDGTPPEPHQLFPGWYGYPERISVEVDAYAEHMETTDDDLIYRDEWVAEFVGMVPHLDTIGDDGEERCNQIHEAIRNSMNIRKFRQMMEHYGLD